VHVTLGDVHTARFGADGYNHADPFFSGTLGVR
jgi:hypothetical protein